jgi:hypothetical protein
LLLRMESSVSASGAIPASFGSASKAIPASLAAAAREPVHAGSLLPSTGPGADPSRKRPRRGPPAFRCTESPLCAAPGQLIDFAVGRWLTESQYAACPRYEIIGLRGVARLVPFGAVPLAELGDAHLRAMRDDRGRAFLRLAALAAEALGQMHWRGLEHGAISDRTVLAIFPTPDGPSRVLLTAFADARPIVNVNDAAEDVRALASVLAALRQRIHGLGRRGQAKAAERAEAGWEICRGPAGARPRSGPEGEGGWEICRGPAGARPRSGPEGEGGSAGWDDDARQTADAIADDSLAVDICARCGLTPAPTMRPRALDFSALGGNRSFGRIDRRQLRGHAFVFNVAGMIARHNLATLPAPAEEGRAGEPKAMPAGRAGEPKAMPAGRAGEPKAMPAGRAGEPKAMPARRSRPEERVVIRRWARGPTDNVWARRLVLAILLSERMELLTAYAAPACAAWLACTLDLRPGEERPWMSANTRQHIRAMLNGPVGPEAILGAVQHLRALERLSGPGQPLIADGTGPHDGFAAEAPGNRNDLAPSPERAGPRRGQGQGQDSQNDPSPERAGPLRGQAKAAAVPAGRPSDLFRAWLDTQTGNQTDLLLAESAREAFSMGPLPTEGTHRHAAEPVRRAATERLRPIPTAFCRFRREGLERTKGGADSEPRAKRAAKDAAEPPSPSVRTPTPPILPADHEDDLFACTSPPSSPSLYAVAEDQDNDDNVDDALAPLLRMPAIAEHNDCWLDDL